MNFLLNSEPSQNGSVLFVIIGVIVVAILYIGLAYLRKWIERKQIAEQQAVIPEEDDSEEVAAITAAIALILGEEAKEEGREAPAFRVVSFKRTNNRRIG
jgi:cbb3-type cytochrome oxidase subunit 3